jgi:hypothetical protein
MNRRWPAQKSAVGADRRDADSQLHKADDEVRTRDLKLGKLALYQLSYVRAWR